MDSGNRDHRHLNNWHRGLDAPFFMGYIMNVQLKPPMTATAAPEFVDHICEYFDEKLRDPNNWTFPVTDKGIDGIEIVKKEYGLWKDVVKQNNIGRFLGTNQEKVTMIADDIEQNGIDCTQPPVFIDITTGDILTGGHRHDACALRKIPGYMFVYVKCDDKWAQKRFAKALNNERVFHATLNGRDEVIEHIKFGIKHNMIKCEQDIIDEIQLIANNALSKTKQGTIVKEMVSFIVSNGNTDFKTERYCSHNDNTYQDFVARSTDVYVNDVLQGHDHNHYINMSNWGSRLNPLLAHAAKVPVNSWLNIQASVDTPSRVESLEVKRGKVHSVLLENLSEMVDKLVEYKFGKMGQMGNGCYPWQHKNCQHAFLAQDFHKEDVAAGQFIRV